MDEMDDFDEMAEPVPCPDCDRWVELQETRACLGCRKLYCRACLKDGECERCRPQGTRTKPKTRRGSVKR